MNSKKTCLIKINYKARSCASCNRLLTEMEHRTYNQISKTMARVEQVLVYFYQTLNYKYNRAKTLLSNELKFTMNSILYNIFTVNLITT